MIRKHTCILIFITVNLFQLVTAGEWANPLIPQRADPWVYRHAEGRYYFTASVPSYDRIELRTADTLEGLACAEPVTIWEKHDSGPMSFHIWAPELHRIDGKWYIYFAAGEVDSIWNIRMYVLENASPDPLTGTWVEKGKIETPWESFALDATTFSHKDKQYLVWAQYMPDGVRSSAMWIAELANPWTLATEPVLLSEPEYDWEIQLFRVNEGPAVLKRNGRVFISYSASGTDHNYAMGLLWVDEDAELLKPGNWSKSPEPVFQSCEEHGIYGPGHNSFTTDGSGRDVLVYHGRGYKELKGSPLRDPNRHARLQHFDWSSDGFPDFGKPAKETIGKVADRPLYRDPVYDGAADPVVIWNPHRARWWMFYTNRRANAEDVDGVTWVHGTRIGIAESCDGGASWTYAGTANIDLPVEVSGSQPTHWAPEVITGPDGMHHMYLTVVPGIFKDWNHPRSIAHLTSKDLRNWRYESVLKLATDKVIDACVVQLPDGRWRMWYNNERDGKSIYYAESKDLYTWVDKSKSVGDRSGEGPKVFRWHDAWWMITDIWQGLAVYRSGDALQWVRQTSGDLLKEPGTGPDDGTFGHHVDVVVQADRAFIFYFTHPGQSPSERSGVSDTRRSTLHVAELTHENGKLAVDRNAPVRIQLDPGK